MKMNTSQLHFTLLIAMCLGAASYSTFSFASGSGAITPLMLASAETHRGDATVTKIDIEEKKVELDHGPIESLGWSGMIMYFDVDNAELLDDIRVSDKVDFEFIQTRDKRYVITDIETQ